MKNELINSTNPEHLVHGTANSEAEVFNKFLNLTWRIAEGILKFKKKEGEEHPRELQTFKYDLNGI